MHHLPHGRRAEQPLTACTNKAERLACANLRPTGHREGRVEHRRCDVCAFGAFGPAQAFDRDYGPPTDHPPDPRNDDGIDDLELDDGQDEPEEEACV